MLDIVCCINNIHFICPLFSDFLKAFQSVYQFPYILCYNVLCDFVSLIRVCNALWEDITQGIALLMPIRAIGSWIFVPILYLFDRAPAGDDVTKFIVSSSIAPWIVVLGAIALLVSCVFLLGRKRLSKTIGVQLHLRYKLDNQ